MSVKNAGKYNKLIKIVKVENISDSDGFSKPIETDVLSTYANVITTKGYTMIKNASDFENAYTNFTIRYPQAKITRDMFIKFNGKTYIIDYLNNINEESVELEMQAHVVDK